MNNLTALKIKNVLSSLPAFVNKQGSARLLAYTNVFDANKVQSTLNALVSLYDHTLVYNYLTNKAIFDNINAVIATPENNLVVNTRLISESDARYIFGHGQTNEPGHALFSEIDPTIKNPARADHLFVSEVFYKDFIIVDELKLMSRDTGLLAVPLLLKHWENIRDYFTENIKELKNVLSKNLELKKCVRYSELVLALDESAYSSPTIEVTEMGKKEAYWLLLATMIKRHFKIQDNNVLTDDQIGLLLFKCIGNENLDGLNVKLPPKKPYVENTQSRVARIQFGNDKDITIVKPVEENILNTPVANPNLPAPILPARIQNNPKSIEDELKKFFDAVSIEGFTDSHSFKEKFQNLVKSLGNSEVTINTINGYNVPSFITSVDAYRIYITILAELILKMHDNNNVTAIPKNKLETIGIALLKCIYNFNLNVKGVNLSEYNVLLNKLNNPTSNISLYVSINKLIADFFNFTSSVAGGANNTTCYDYSPAFAFFQHAYLIDALVNHKKIQSTTPKYNNNNFDSTDIELFWNGIAYAEYEKLDLEVKYLYSNIYDTFFLEDRSNGTVFKTSGENATRVVFAASLFAVNMTTTELLEKLTNLVLADLKNEECPIDFTSKIDERFGNKVIRSLDKLKVVDTPEKLPAFLEAVIQTQKDNLQPATMLEVLIFLFGLLEKLGFTVEKKISKTNMTINIEPAPRVENISKKVNNPGFIEKYGKWIEGIFKGGSKAVIAFPREEQHITIANLEKYMGGNFTADEEDDLLRSVQILVDTDSVTIDNLHRLIPYYVKEQIKMIIEPDCSGGANSQEDIVSMFLRKVENIETKPSDVTADTEKAIDRFLQEKYINSLNRLVPFYDSKINFINSQDKSSYLLKHTLETIKYMRTNMKLNLSEGIKKGIQNIFLLKQRSDEFCYKSFILVQYIRHMIDELQNKLKIQPVPKTIGFTDFSSFYKIISTKLENHEKRYKDDVIAKSLEYFNQRVGSDIKVNELDQKAFLQIFDPTVAEVKIVR